MLGAGTGLRQDGTEVPEHALGLLDDGRADDPARSIERRLSGKVDGATATGDDGMAEPGRRREVRRIHMLPDCHQAITLPPSTMSP